ncbi:MAG: replication initiation protein [Butyrivibrio sp.]|uniref:replication initiation protein n=1 Tax=Butyrivibrio sp. TaxID=28121 RepID=UPI001B555B90|nr:replication initiation protein [Butyrivibrio sp.]MBP3783131.1 replication initiation protein [Butyrivibrio sp.]
MFYRKSNALIYSMDNGSLLAHQLFIIGMSVAYVDEDGRVNSVVYGSDIKKFLSLKSNSIYKRIRELCEKDSKESIFKWQVSIKGDVKDQYEMFNVVDEARFENGKFTMIYNKSLTNLIINLEDDFTPISVEEVMKLRTVEALRLYELLRADRVIKMRNRKLGDSNKATFNLSELKSILAPNAGMEKEKGASNFNKRILSTAVKEINEKTSLNVEYTPVEEDNIVGGVDFCVSRKESKTPQPLEENSMYAIAERDKDICVGTVTYKPDPFLYLVFVMGICNIDEKEELLSSTVTAEDIAQALNMKMEDVCNEMKAISNRSVDRASIYDWMTRKEIFPEKRVLEQIVTDATYSDGIITMNYNHSLNKYLKRLNAYYKCRIKDLTEELNKTNY